LLRRVAVLLALVLPLTLVGSQPAIAGSESEFISRTNGARTSRGLRAYAVRGDLTGIARRQAARMAARGEIYHNPNLTSEVSGWSSVGENVGRGSSVASIHDAFMGSSAHRSNILSTVYTEVGIGTATSGSGEIFVSEVFRRPSGTVVYAPAPPPPPVVQRPVLQRASRGAPRRPLVVTPQHVRKVRIPVVDPTPARLRTAWTLYRKTRPVGSLERAIVFLRTTRVIADERYPLLVTHRPPTGFAALN
jgi:hypothetical protein